MRLLHVADIHLGRPFRWLGPERGRRRRQELRDSFARVLDLAAERRVDALGIAGDLFEIENSPPSLGEMLRASFARHPNLPILIAPGNHDYPRAGSLYTSVDWPANVRIFDRPELAPAPVADGTIWGAAFPGPRRDESPLAGFRAPNDGLHVGLFHADVVDDGARSIYGPLAPGSIAASGLRCALLGHVHAGRIDADRRFAYPGSLEPLDVGEVGPRWALLWEIRRENVAVERIALARRRVIRERLDVGEISTRDELRRRLAERAAEWENADLDLTVVGQLRGDLLDPEVIRQALADYDVALTVEARPDDDLLRLAAQPTTLGAFVRAVLERLPDEPTEERARWEDVLRVGLAAFRGEEVALS